MYSTRREALRSVALFGGALFFSRALVACAVDAGPEGASADGERAVDRSEEALVSCKPPVISANHGHSLVVSAADVTAGAAKTYSIAGMASHDHTITITAAQFAMLGAGRAVTATSTTTGGHTHTVTVTCTVSTPPATCASGASASAITGNHGHSLLIPKADLAAGVAKTYSIQGTASHAHQVSISAAQLATLKAGQSISVTSSLVFAHVHTVTVRCA